MEKHNLAVIHASLLKIMDEIDRICRIHQMRYSLSSGSLLGAVRHHGIIPWDDDIDICMPRTDYDRFLEVCKEALGKQFGIVTINNTREYGYGFSKIVLKGCKIRQNSLKEGNNIFELWIDVFPYDHVPDSGWKKTVHKYRNYFLVKLLEEKYDGLNGEAGLIKRICFRIFHILNVLIPPDKAKKALLSNMIRYNQSSTDKITSLSGYYGYEKETLPAGFFEDLKDYSFEGRRYLGFSNYDIYLKQLYGNYMEIPSEDKRHTHDLEVLEMKVD